MADSKEDIGFILFTQVGSGHNLVGERHALAVAENTAHQTLAVDIISGNVLHLKLNHTIVHSNNITGLQILVQRLVIHANPSFIAVHLVCGKRKVCAFRNGNLAGGEGSDAIFRTFCVQHNCNRQPQLLPDLLNQFNLFFMLFMGAVGKIQPRNVHAGKAHLCQCLLIFTGRTNGANYFRLSHTMPPISYRFHCVLFYFTTFHTIRQCLGI